MDIVIFAVTYLNCFLRRNLTFKAESNKNSNFKGLLT